jgi:hypothetical protein
VIETSREHLGWVLHEAGPENADHRVLLLPGALASWAFYEDLLAEPSIREAPVRFHRDDAPVEIVSTSEFSGPVVLLSPSFSRRTSRCSHECSIV